MFRLLIKKILDHWKRRKTFACKSKWKRRWKNLLVAHSSLLLWENPRRSSRKDRQRRCSVRVAVNLRLSSWFERRAKWFSHVWSSPSNARTFPSIIVLRSTYVVSVQMWKRHFESVQRILKSDGQIRVQIVVASFEFRVSKRSNVEATKLGETRFYFWIRMTTFRSPGSPSMCGSPRRGNSIRFSRGRISTTNLRRETEFHNRRSHPLRLRSPRLFPRWRIYLIDHRSSSFDWSSILLDVWTFFADLILHHLKLNKTIGRRKCSFSSSYSSRSHLNCSHLHSTVAFARTRRLFGHGFGPDDLMTDASIRKHRRHRSATKDLLRWNSRYRLLLTSLAYRR